MTDLNKPRKIDAIMALKPGIEVTVRGDEADGVVTWHDGNPTNITEEQIAAKLTELRAEYDTKEYQRLREPEYPTVQDLVVALYDAEDKAAIDSKRAEIKLKYPKPGA